MDNDRFVICTPKQSVYSRLQTYYINTIANAAKEILDHPIEIYITVAQENEPSTIINKWDVPPKDILKLLT